MRTLSLPLLPFTTPFSSQGQMRLSRRAVLMRDDGGGSGSSGSGGGVGNSTSSTPRNGTAETSKPLWTKAPPKVTIASIAEAAY